MASFVNSAQADLARMQLAMEDIPTFLGSATLVTWFWHYSNFSGGAKVFVSAADAERAVAVLRPSREAAPLAPPWECKRCGEHIEESWKTCWRCGTATDGEEDPDFFEPPAVLPFPLSSSPRTWAIIIGVAIPLIFLFSHASLTLLIAWFIVVAAVLALQSLWPATEDRAEAEPATADLVAEVAEPVADDGYAAIEERSPRRAWQAAVLSLRFPPLAVDAIWLLVRLSLSEEPLKTARSAVVYWRVDIQRFPACDIFVACAYLCRPLAATET